MDAKWSLKALTYHELLKWSVKLTFSVISPNVTNIKSEIVIPLSQSSFVSEKGNITFPCSQNKNFNTSKSLWSHSLSKMLWLHNERFIHGFLCNTKLINNYTLCSKLVFTFSRNYWLLNLCKKTMSKSAIGTPDQRVGLNWLVMGSIDENRYRY